MTDAAPGSRGSGARVALSAVAFAAIIPFFMWLVVAPVPPALDATLIVGCVLAVFPAVRGGRLLLDRRPTLARAEWVTSGVHAALILLLGVALIRAIVTGPGWRGVELPVPHVLAVVLVWVTGIASGFTVVNLAVRGLGAPFAVALSRRLATDWWYARTRNPMVLTTLAWIVAMGLWLRSALFLGWVVFLLTPAWLYFLRVYEERELEIRFGDAYRAYRNVTPFFWPRLRALPGVQLRNGGA